jgi:hypothetical protein
VQESECTRREEGADLQISQIIQSFCSLATADFGAHKASMFSLFGKHAAEKKESHVASDAAEERLVPTGAERGGALAERERNQSGFTARRERVREKNAKIITRAFEEEQRKNFYI